MNEKEKKTNKFAKIQQQRSNNNKMHNFSNLFFK